MKKNRIMFTATAIGILFSALLGGCGSESIRTYEGQVKSLQEVAVLRTSEDTCPITRIDGVSVGEEYEAGNEYHLLPGEHTIQIVNTIGDCDTYCRIEFSDLNYEFQAGGVYAILQTKPLEPSPESQEKKEISWTPEQGVMLGFVSDFGNDSRKDKSQESSLSVADQGDVVSFAAQNPDYFKHSPAWKKLRKENGLNPSLTERIKSQLVAWGFIKIKPEPTVVAEQKPVEAF